MAKAKATPKGGVDRWTSNGKGINITKVAISKSEASKIEKESNKRNKK